MVVIFWSGFPYSREECLPLGFRTVTFVRISHWFSTEADVP